MARFIKDAFRTLSERFPFAKAEGPTEWLAPDPSDAGVTTDAPFPGISEPVVSTTPAQPDKKIAATRTITKSQTKVVEFEVDLTVDIRKPAADKVPAEKAPTEPVAEPIAEAPAAIEVEPAVTVPKQPRKTAPRKVAARKVPAAATATAPEAPTATATASEAPATATATASAAAPEVPAPKKRAPRKAAAKKAPAQAPTEAAAQPAKKAAPAKQEQAAEAPAQEEASASTDQPTAASPLPIREGEEPWTEAEIAEVREDLNAERERLLQEIAAADAQLTEMLRDAGDGAVEDQADAGSRTFDREQEISLAANTAEMLEQVDRALRRLADGEYGVCENCGKPIGKMRLQAFPRATLCLTCKEQQERR